jgi:hypothetical protein
MNRLARAAFCTLLLPLGLALLPACESPPEKRATGRWTLFDIAERFGTGAALGKGASAEFPGGFAPEGILASRSALKIALAFSEGQPAAYVITELWANYPAVWVQPMYVLTTGWDPAAKKFPVLRVIFSVGPKSGFYSPFWRVSYVVVPTAADADRYTAARQILEDKLPLLPGPDRLCVLAPGDIALEGGVDAVRPLFGDKVGTVGRAKTWLDGEPIDVLDFGVARFTADEKMVVDEQPLFIFMSRDGAGRLRPANLPNVGGTGPLYAVRPALGGATSRPAFGSLWRFHPVTLPATAAAFIPPGSDFDALREQIVGVDVPAVTGPGATLPNVKDFAGRVALNPACFDEPQFPAGCQWLDSQASIETLLPRNIRPSDIRATCPLVTYAGKPVAN